MLRSALVVVAAASLLSACKKADSKEVAPATAGDSRVAAKPPADGSAADTVGEVKGSDAAETGPATPPGSDQGTGSTKGGTDKVVKGKPDADAKGAGDTTTSGDGSFTLTVTSSQSVAAGAAATATLTVKPGKGYHMNKDFPTKLTIEPPAGVSCAKTEFEAEDAAAFDEDHLALEVACTPGATGSYAVSGKLKFAVCTESTCDPKRQAISFAVAAK